MVSNLPFGLFTIHTGAGECVLHGFWNLTLRAGSTYIAKHLFPELIATLLDATDQNAPEAQHDHQKQDILQNCLSGVLPHRV